MSKHLMRSRHSASEISLPRSSSTSPLHSASVHVRDVSHLANPSPARRRGESGKTLGEDYLSPARLREISGEPDLNQVTYLQVSVNTQAGSLGNFGGSLPRLAELRCVESVVPCVRDLGTGLGQLTVVWLSRCGVRDLDGLPSLSSLQELYLSHNEVRDVSVAAMLPLLRVLDIESNRLAEEDQLGYLALCGQLTSLSLSGNPLALLLSSPLQGGEAGYRAAVCKVVPQLNMLDDVPVGVVTPPISGHTSVPDILSMGVWRCDQLREGCASAPGRPRTAVSPGEVGRGSPLLDDSSDLTHGMKEVMCGNPVRALKARRRRGLASQLSPTPLGSLAEETYVSMATSVVELTWGAEHLTLSPTPSPPPSLPEPPVARPHSAAADLRHRRYHRPSPSQTRSPSEEEVLAPPLYHSPSPPLSSPTHTPQYDTQ